jgi:hypothetical protein
MHNCATTEAMENRSDFLARALYQVLATSLRVSLSAHALSRIAIVPSYVERSIHTAGSVATKISSMPDRVMKACADVQRLPTAAARLN